MGMAIGTVMVAGCSRPAADQRADASVGQPIASHAPPTAEGTVLETMDASQYTYVKVKTASGDIWAASSTFKVAVGDTVVVPLDSPMDNYHSQALNRDFARIYFATAITRPGETPPMSVAEATAAPLGPLPVTDRIPPAPGGISIEHLWANRKALSGRAVTLRGRIVKVNGNIMDLDWTHIQDGSGDATAGTNDITITSKPGSASARLGDVVTVTGTVVLDKDFGAGYAYAVILENATIAVK
jgi:hypothetical protein